MRKEFSPKIKVAAYKRSGGYCERCTALLYVGKFHYDHTNPDGMTGEPTLENCAVLCVNCHGEKTKQDVKDIAKAKRRERNNLGAKRSSRWPKRPMSSTWSA